MSVIGIDPGTKCGWCVRHDGGGMDSGTWNLKGGRFEGGVMSLTSGGPESARSILDRVLEIRQ